MVALRQKQRTPAAQRAQALQQRQQEDATWEAVCRERQARLRPPRPKANHSRLRLMAAHGMIASTA